jgi:L-fuconolactonase
MTQMKKAAPISRRTWIAGSLLMPVIGIGASFAADGPADLDIIDCHTHFFDPAQPESVARQHGIVLPKQLRGIKSFRPVTGTVIVEASPKVEVNQWLLDLAKDDPFVVGIVGNLTPGDPDFTKHLKRFAANPLFRGIRISVQLLKKLLDSDALADFRLLAELDLALDVNGSESPNEVARLASKWPSLRIVLNHMGSVALTESAPPAAWQEGIRTAAAHPKVFCKISALVDFAAHYTKKAAPQELNFYRPYIDVVWKSFGDDRVIYASNWPVSEKAASYEVLQRIALSYAFEKGDDATKKFCSLNAREAYKWVERPGRR